MPHENMYITKICSEICSLVHGRAVAGCLHLRSMFFLALFMSFANAILAVSLREEFVYPKLLQQRSDDGRLLLRINDDMTLHLQKSSVLADDLFFTTNAGRQSEDTLWNGSRIEENLYHDSKYQSSIMLYEDDHSVKVEGILSATLRIKPMPSSERSGDASILHKVYEIDDVKQKFDETADTWITPFNVPWFNAPWGPSTQSAPPANRELPEEYVAEVHVVSCSSHEKEFETNEELIAYIAVLMNAVNIWYEGMENPRIRTKIVGITRNTDGDYEVREDGYLIADRTLNRFSEYADKSIPGHPDAVYLMTSQEMASISLSGTIDTGVAGLAFVGTLCGFQNVAIGEDPAGSFKGVYPAAHELAHTLGSAHDGDPGVRAIPNNPGAKDCPWEEGYLMSYADGGTKKFELSPCSQGQIRALLRHVPQTCLDETSDKDYMSSHRKAPGQLISAEDYCNILLKNQGRGVPLMKADMLEECRFQCCLRTYYGPGRCNTEFVPEGMQCAEGKTCRKGVCGDFKWER
ncbi:venom metalloproteinase antarease TserMP_A-like [Dermacentor albipictus]|uniref:venom metalloproteinase antarease TserMP_A-like n=1 Tax=Dermacentor albipictus TaxID=60249 RepID=UPI0038FC2E93